MGNLQHRIENRKTQMLYDVRLLPTGFAFGIWAPDNSPQGFRHGSISCHPEEGVSRGSG
jgi:hypothetical protein